MVAPSNIVSPPGEVQDSQNQLDPGQNESAEEIYIGQYICDRLVQLGVTVRYAASCAEPESYPYLAYLWCTW
jgi:hypothetical protein